MAGASAARRWRAVALVAVGIAVGSTMTAAPVTAHVGGSVAHLVGHLKKTFYTKTQANQRFYTKTDADARFAAKPEVEQALAGDLRIGIANGVGNSLGCASGTLAVGVANAKGEPVDHRFTFQVPGAAPQFGHIRASGSIRLSSANVASVTHTAGTGVYCIVFNVSIAQAALESSVVSVHFEG